MRAVALRLLLALALAATPLLPASAQQAQVPAAPARAQPPGQADAGQTSTNASTNAPAHGPAPAGVDQQPGAIARTVTHHDLTLADGRHLGYRAIAETLPVKDAKGAVTAEIFVLSYLADAGGPSRPVTFAFNGGPGAASAYLNLGALGPRVMETGKDGRFPAPPGHLIDNPASWLGFTDLVFVDPVGTGYSHATGGGSDADKPFWSVSGDLDSLSDIVRQWLVREGRWGSPRFMVGESYGGYRVARLARDLERQQGIAFNGIVMVSPALDFFAISPESHALLPWALALPSMIATAQAQGKSSEPALSPAEAEHFALNDYLTGIAAIDPPGPGPAPALVQRLSGLLGLRPELIRRYDGRIPIGVFARRLLGDGRRISLYDGTAIGPNPGRDGLDPILDASVAPMSGAFNAYARNELDLHTDLPFLLLNPAPVRHWDWEGARGGPSGYHDAIEPLEQALSITPGMGVLVIHGRTDLVTPYMTSRWLLDRLDLPDDIRARVAVSVLDGGHMMYFRSGNRGRLSDLARAFYAAHAGGG